MFTHDSHPYHIVSYFVTAISVAALAATLEIWGASTSVIVAVTVILILAIRLAVQVRHSRASLFHTSPGSGSKSTTSKSTAGAVNVTTAKVGVEAVQRKAPEDASAQELTAKDETHVNTAGASGGW